MDRLLSFRFDREKRERIVSRFVVTLNVCVCTYEYSTFLSEPRKEEKKFAKERERKEKRKGSGARNFDSFGMEGEDRRGLTTLVGSVPRSHDGGDDDDDDDRPLMAAL